MAVTQPSLSKSKTSPLSSSKRKALEIKKRVLRKKTTDPINRKTKKVSFDIPSKAVVSYKPKVCTTNGTPDSHAKSLAMGRAQEVQANLSPEFPSFIKPMLPSHVTGGFWLGLPKSFCDLHLPKHDETVVLVDESELESETKYLIAKAGLSAGWRGFSIAHKLVEGDTLVFQLIKPCKFKVFIVRVDSLTELDGAIIGLLNLDACSKPISMVACGMEEGGMEEGGKNHGKELGSVESRQENTQESMVISDQSENDDEDLGSASEVLEGIRFSQSLIDFKDVKGIQDFNILVNDLIIDSEIPKHLHIKYYELCCSQGSYLHDSIIEGLNIKLTAGIISETVNIADAVRACKLTTPQSDFEIWDKTLKAFEELGLKVGFIRARIQKIVGLLFESEKIVEEKQVELMKAKEERRSVEEKLCGLKGVIKNLDGEIVKMKGKRLEPAFRHEVNAPW